MRPGFCKNWKYDASLFDPKRPFAISWNIVEGCEDLAVDLLAWCPNWLGFGPDESYAVGYDALFGLPEYHIADKR